MRLKVQRAAARFGFLWAALLGILSFPPLPLAPLAWIALIPFLLACVHESPRRVFGRAYLAGLVFFAGICYWIGLNKGAPPALTWASMLATVAVLALSWGISAAVCTWAMRRAREWGALLLPFLYVSFEMFFGLGEMGFAWPIWALSQANLLLPCQLCDLTDVFGLSFWVVLLNSLCFLALRFRGISRRVLFVICLVVFVVPWLYGAIRLGDFRHAKQVRLGVVQANIPAERKWEKPADETLALYEKQSEIVLAARPSFLVWPETAVPVPLRFRPWARDEIHQWVDRVGVPLLTGALDYHSENGRDELPLNAAFLVTPHSRELPQYAKIHLVPFGERIPGQRLFPFLGRIRLGQAEFAPGKSLTLFEPVPQVKVGCLICFEVVFPEVAAGLVREGADILVNLTNDGWYGNSSGPYQHLALARLRAIATRR
ncbi:MAG: apolipoprotein N-acyltransferase, partial [Calditrichaeota bacterium]|nr:apolipoprotein N-acyltransferase [Calditrichota bacterium]